MRREQEKALEELGVPLPNPDKKNSASAATDSNSAETDSKETSKSSISEKKNNGKGTYIYDENLGYGWYLDDENLDNKDLENDDSYQYTYTQNGYYCNSYIIEMGWNLFVKNQDYYGSTEIVFEDKSKMTVYFSDSAKDYLNDMCHQVT